MERRGVVSQVIPYDPKLLLDPSNWSEPTFLHDKYVPFFGAFAGFLAPVYRNYTRRRPLYAGIQVTIACTLLGFGFGYLTQKQKEQYWADRDAILRHYVELHPEDFPAQERTLVGDMLKPWIPCR